MENSSLHKLFNNPKLKLDPQCFPLRNRTLEFMGTDNERLWKKNIKNPKLQFYRDNKITYQLNNYGYRTPYNFNQGDEVDIFLGCSHTIGYGVLFEHTWPYIVNKRLGSNLVNLAVGGCSIDRQFRELYTWMNFFKVRNIFHFQPLYAREEFISNNQYIKFSIHSAPKEVLNNLKEEFLISYFGSDTYILKKYITTILAIENIAHRLNSNYYFIDQLPEFNPNSIPARDDMHMDVEGHKNIASEFITKYTSKDTSIELLRDEFIWEQTINLI